MADNYRDLLSGAWVGLVALVVVVCSGCLPIAYAPIQEGTILDMALEPGDEESLGVASYFSHYEDDVLTYTASSATESAATVSMDESRLTVAAVAVGESEVTVTATDSDGDTALQYFKVTVEVSD